MRVKMPFRFGIVGAGAVAETHVRAMEMLPDVRPVAVADVDLRRARSFAARHGIAKAYRSVEDLLEGSPVDAVDVLTPHHLHLSAVEAAVRARKPVLVEKALAETAVAADKLIEVCQAGGVVLGGIFQNRFSEAGITLKRTVEERRLGRLFQASVSVNACRSAAYYHSVPWRGRKAEAGGGVLMVQAIHALDLLQWTLGMPRRVLARTATAVHPIEVEDLAVGLLEFEGGVVAVLQATTAAVPEVPPELEIRGDAGTAAVFDSRGDLGFWCSTREAPASLPSRWSLYASHYHEQEPTIPMQASPAPHAENIRDFVAAVQTDRPPRVDGIEAAKVVRIIDTLYRSAERGEWLPVAR